MRPPRESGWRRTASAVSRSVASPANTRRYHALLTAATRPPLGRIAMLSKFEETLIIDGERFELSANQYPGAIHPNGFEFITGFRLDPFPIWTFLRWYPAREEDLHAARRELCNRTLQLGFEVWPPRTEGFARIASIAFLCRLPSPAASE